MMKYNYIDLFSGIGGFALGAYWAGMKFENHFFSEVEKYPIELYRLRFPGAIPLGDITKIDWEELKNKYPGEWIITGGFPCQDISVAGKGAGIHGKRSGLWFEMWKSIRILQPRFAIVENVGALLNRGLTDVLGSLAKIGYDAEWQDIRAEDVGAPHRRERIWIVAYPGYLQRGSKEKRILRGVQKDRQECNQTIRSSKTRKMANSSSPGLQKREKSEQQKPILSTQYGSSGKGKEFPNPTKQRLQRQKSKGWNRRKPGLPTQCSWWDTEPAVGRLADGIPNRVDRLKGLGNAIVPQIAVELFELIKPYVEEQ